MEIQHGGLDSQHKVAELLMSHCSDRQAVSNGCAATVSNDQLCWKRTRPTTSWLSKFEQIM